MEMPAAESTDTTEANNYESIDLNIEKDKQIFCLSFFFMLKH
jgi:hypothetical protein